MFKSIHQELLVDTLLNTLEVERYVRGPLLLNLVDELSSSGFDAAVIAAKELLATVEASQVDDAEFALGVRALRQLVTATTAPVSRTLARTGALVHAAQAANAAHAAHAANGGWPLTA